MSNLEAFIYGVIQGLSEFLPVSSSGHLALLPHLMTIDDPGVKFDLMMHLGTALAIIVYFKNDVMNLLLQAKPLILFQERDDKKFYFARNFTIATIATVIFIFIFLPISKYAREPWVIITNLSLFGAILWYADWFNKKKFDELNSMEEKEKWKYALMIGIAQSFAIFPGVSRSGITITMALLLGMTRKNASSFSFLLSLPIIFAGIIKEMPELIKTEDGTGFIPLIVGVITSFVVGLITIHFFMNLIKKTPLFIFSIYRWIIALAVYLVIYY